MPTNSEEPSGNPTVSEEPSENPTSSEEPSENPTSSEEPSENPTGDLDDTIAAFICAEENQFFLSTLCALIAASPAIFGILNDDFIVDFAELALIPGFDPAPFLNIVPPRLPAHHDPFLGALGLAGRTAGEDGEKNSNGNNRRLEDREYTLFAPDNDAMYRFVRRSLEDLFDLGNDEVVKFFETSGFDVLNEEKLVIDFILSFPGRLVLSNILLTHITNGEVTSSDLDCTDFLVMLNGQLTATQCIGVSSSPSKFQYGEGNRQTRPRITGKDFEVSNGIVHIVNEVILPDLDSFVVDGILNSVNFFPTANPSSEHASGSFVVENSALKDAIIYIPRNGDTAEGQSEQKGGQ